MKKFTTLLIILLIVQVAIVTYNGYQIRILKKQVQDLTTAQKLEVKDPLTKSQRAWFNALMWCESRANPKAINPKDRDNTPSYGEFQFKPSTYNYFMKKYNIGTSTDYMDYKYQEKIVEQMINKGDVNWHQQFPDCTQKLGRPPVTPKNSTSTVDKQ